MKLNKASQIIIINIVHNKKKRYDMKHFDVVKQHVK